MNATLNELLNEALIAWVKLTDVDLENTSWVIKAGKVWDKYNLQKYTQMIEDARDLDETGLTSFMMLRGIFESYIKEFSFSAYDLMLDPESVAEAIEPMHDLRDILESQQVVTLIGEFAELIREGAEQYGYTVPEEGGDLDAWLDSKIDLAFIRRDALLAMQTLDAHQFTQGEPREAEFKVNRQIFEFWNINSLVEALRGQHFTGITLCLMRDPEALWSHFAFAIRNGDTITVLTDKKKEPHPAFRSMARPRGVQRDFSDRARKYWFPYELVGTDVNEDQTELYVKARTALVPKNAQAVALADLNACIPGTVIWLVLMFELIYQKYGVQNHLLPDLSYTGEMVVDPYALVGETAALVTSGHYKPLEMPHQTADTLSNDSIEETIGVDKFYKGRRATGLDWMIERYGPRVPEEALNLVGEQGKAKALLGIHEADPALSRETFMERLGGKRSSHSWDKDYSTSHHIRLRTLDPMTFGTAASIREDAAWTARWNQCKVIQRLADAEFEELKDEMFAWYMDRLEMNWKFLFDAAARGTLRMGRHDDTTLPPDVDMGHGISAPAFGTEGREMEECLRQKEDISWGTGYRHSLPSYGPPPARFGEAVYSHGQRFYCCERDDVKATIFTHIAVTVPESISTVTGVPVEKLPWPFRYYNCGDPYVGNYILNRLDPANHELHNPWVPGHRNRHGGLNLNIGIFHCKRAFNARRKALGLTKKVWEPRPKRVIKR
jgi:hypothetical protein